ncbi:hypothetical protein X798_00399 [Onchocerca flexuosa]|uniref:Uncharacterized protein n=2 Tax=Onchocerca flexuosa TaxID=387005 RepID=A0A183H5L4_9BILA|nr:hypothetical protein X798_00399 [Onchocerca flexuosa]VDO34157.1 unnamed protein product [Onchocerca flexuosa]
MQYQFAIDLHTSGTGRQRGSWLWRPRKRVLWPGVRVGKLAGREGRIAWIIMIWLKGGRNKSNGEGLLGEEQRGNRVARGRFRWCTPTDPSPSHQNTSYPCGQHSRYVSNSKSSHSSRAFPFAIISITLSGTV